MWILSDLKASIIYSSIFLRLSCIEHLGLHHWIHLWSIILYIIPSNNLMQFYFASKCKEHFPNFFLLINCLFGIEKNPKLWSNITREGLMLHSPNFSKLLFHCTVVFFLSLAGCFACFFSILLFVSSVVCVIGIQWWLRIFFKGNWIAFMGVKGGGCVEGAGGGDPENYPGMFPLTSPP